MAMRIGSRVLHVSTGGGGGGVSGLPLGHPHLYKIQVFICNVKCIRMLRIGYA